MVSDSDEGLQEFMYVQDHVDDFARKALNLDAGQSATASGGRDAGQAKKYAPMSQEGPGSLHEWP